MGMGGGDDEQGGERQWGRSVVWMPLVVQGKGKEEEAAAASWKTSCPLSPIHLSPLMSTPRHTWDHHPARARLHPPPPPALVFTPGVGRPVTHAPAPTGHPTGFRESCQRLLHAPAMPTPRVPSTPMPHATPTRTQLCLSKRGCQAGAEAHSLFPPPLPRLFHSPPSLICRREGKASLGRL